MTAKPAQDPEGYELWAAGKLVPARITQLLDRHQLYGPEVDIACGATEPAVDKWEAGEWYPTWEQACRLADLVLATSVKALCVEPVFVPAWVCGRRCEFVVPEPQQLTFRPAALAREPAGLW